MDRIHRIEKRILFILYILSTIVRPPTQATISRAIRHFCCNVGVPTRQMSARS